MSYPKSVTFNQARKIISEAIAESLPLEQLPLQSALGRVLAEDMLAAMDVPAWDCSRFDGYAVDADALRLAGAVGLPVCETIHAGDDATHLDDSAQAHPIMTGAMMPQGMNAVIMKEHANVSANGQLKTEQKVEKGLGVRRQAEDMSVGKKVLGQGRRLRPEDLGLLASVGVGQVSVHKKPQVVILVTGDELIQPGKPCQPGQIYDANSFIVKDLLKQMGCDVLGIKFIKDCPDEVSKAMTTLKNKQVDLVISIGGVSMGDKDFIPQCLAEHGQVMFHKTSIKPGYPLLFGQLGQAWYFGLPGNPVSTFTTICQFVWYAIRKMQGVKDIHNLNWRGKITHDVNKSHYRREFMRGYYVQSFDGSIEVTVCGSQQSSRIQSLVEANCFVVIDESQQDIKSGELVRIQPFHQFNHLASI